MNKRTDVTSVKEFVDAILAATKAFSDPLEPGQYRNGLSAKQYAALRDLETLRIDYGDSRDSGVFGE